MQFNGWAVVVFGGMLWFLWASGVSQYPIATVIIFMFPVVWIGCSCAWDYFTLGKYRDKGHLRKSKKTTPL